MSPIKEIDTKKASKELNKYSQNTALLAVIWTLVVGVSLISNIVQINNSKLESGIIQARAIIKRDILFRNWITIHGGVYIPVSEEFQPSTYLDVEEKNVSTPSGKKLTLYNPALIIRKMMESRAMESDVTSRITSLKPLRPGNAPDTWEKKALEKLEKGFGEVHEVVEKEHSAHFRMVMPLKTKKGCLKCHAEQGYKVGDVRGGISVAIPMHTLHSIIDKNLYSVIVGHLFLWLLGMAGLMFISLRMKRGEKKRISAEQELANTNKQYYSVLSNTIELIFMLDENRLIKYWNPPVESHFKQHDLEGVPFEFIICRTYKSEKLEKLFSQVEKSGESCSEIVKCYGFSYDVSITPISDEESTTSYVCVVRDITEKVRSEFDLYKYKAAIEQSIDGIAIADMVGNIIFSNKAWAKMHEVSDEDVLGKHISIFHTKKQIEEDVIPFNEIVMEQGSNEGEVGHVAESGREFPTWMTTTLLKDISNESIGMVGIAHDISDQKKNEAKLKRAKDSAEKLAFEIQIALDNVEKMREEAVKASQIKGEFLANMSHEIRTPMNGIIGMTRILLETELSKEQKEYAETVKNSGESLLTIINDILHFSKIEAGKIDVEKIDFDVRPAIEVASDTLSLRAQEKGIEFVQIIEPDVPSLITGDPGRLRQILTNLLGNAVKFTETGEVTLCVSVESETDSTVTLKYEVKDTGIGIPEDRHANLFDAFTQADSSMTRKFGGTGLGLSISKRLVEIMNGKIGFKSKEGEGSTFWFIISHEKQSKHVGLEDNVDYAEIKNKNILVVDDSDSSRRWIKMLITSWQGNYYDAKGGSHAYHILKESYKNGDPIDIAIITKGLSDITGATLGQMIKDDPELADTKLVMLAMIGERGDAKKMEELGFSAYLTKPVKESILYNTLLMVLSEESDLKEDDEKQIITKYQADKIGDNRDRILLAEDNMVNRKVALGILSKMGYFCNAVENGKEAVIELKENKYDVVLMDCQMPIMDGYEATRHIRQFQNEVNTQEIPIIAMTAHVMPGDRDKCIEAGMDDYISKPVDPRALQEMIQRWVEDKNEKQSDNKADNDISMSNTENDDNSIFDQVSLLNRMANDKKLANQVINAFISDTPRIFEQLQNAIDSKDLDKIKSLAHALKGASSNISSSDLARVAMELENAEDIEYVNELMDDIEDIYAELIILLKEYVKVNY